MRDIKKGIAIGLTTLCFTILCGVGGYWFSSSADNMEFQVDNMKVAVPQEALAANVNSYLNIRYQPSSNATVIGKMEPGDTVTFVEQVGDWTKIEVNGQFGYVYTQYALTGSSLKKYIKNNLSKFSVSAVQTTEAFSSVYETKKMAQKDPVVCTMAGVLAKGGKVYATKSTAETIKNEYVEVQKAMVNANGLRFRGKASTKGAIYQVLDKGTIMDVVSSDKAKWYKVKYKGKSGFISKDFAKIVTVKENKSNILKSAAKKQGIKVTDMTKNWVTVVYNGETAYVKRSDCQVSAENVDQSSAGKKVVGFLENNVACTVHSVQDGLAKVTLATGETGYVKSDGLKAEIAIKGVELDQDAIAREEAKAVEQAEIKVDLEDVSETRKELIQYAVSFVGNPYVWGGNSLTEGVDCSGFTQQIFAKFNISLNRCSYQQVANGREIALEDIKPGDLVFYFNEKLNRIGHVAIYMGDGQVVHAKSKTSGITISNLNYNSPYKVVNIFGD